MQWPRENHTRKHSENLVKVYRVLVRVVRTRVPVRVRIRVLRVLGQLGFDTHTQHITQENKGKVLEGVIYGTQDTLSRVRFRLRFR